MGRSVIKGGFLGIFGGAWGAYKLKRAAPAAQRPSAPKATKAAKRPSAAPACGCLGLFVGLLAGVTEACRGWALLLAALLAGRAGRWPLAVGSLLSRLRRAPSLRSGGGGGALDAHRSPSAVCPLPVRSAAGNFWQLEDSWRAGRWWLGQSCSFKLYKI